MEIGAHTEEANRRKVVKTEVGERSSRNDRARALTTTREEWFQTLMKARTPMEEVAENTEDQSQSVVKSKIQKVGPLLRDKKNYFEKYFEPTVMSLGPIHHGKEKYQLAEKCKLRLAVLFVESSGKPIEALYKEIVMEIKQLRECFEDEVTKDYDDEQLARMLFIDGCAILQFIYCAVNDKFKELKIKRDSAVFVQQDLFLLENQIPYRLLDCLMGLSKEEKSFRMSIESFIQPQIEVGGGQQAKEGSAGSLERSIQTSKGSEPIHLLDLLRTRMLGDAPKRDHKFSSKIKDKVDHDWQSYWNVQELRAEGIQMKRSGNESHLRNIYFTKAFNLYPGYLWLPPIVVDDLTGPKFMNLIAYEMCSDFDNDFGVTSYISFLRSLIDEAQDVKELRKAKVLHNFLDRDEKVVELFDEIATDLVPNLEIYNSVKRQIQYYFMKRWRPWKLITLSGAVFFALDLIQVWFTIFPRAGSCDDFCKKFTRSLFHGVCGFLYIRAAI
ncbi:hypothetical protein CJ030_MR1G002803 [Morella rubra]|uniref:Uncharacterized protein n=1 Tax=Morella rubra TaxID=262757 RepID=A0A6A1WNS7_9ROSI|nr:hypothetical protein CJ030_MR1G002803 [Morella rubra]